MWCARNGNKGRAGQYFGTDRMFTFTPTTFGDLNAEGYDATQDPGTTEDSVALIAGIAGSGRVLELAIGTGRVALPLAARGIDISGIEGSPAMVDKLREKPGGADIPVVIGDMADVDIDGTFDHIFLIFNTFFNLPDQEAQVRCFANVAKRLAPGGTFLIEAFVPDFSQFSENQRMKVREMTMDRMRFEGVTHDPVRQLLNFQRVTMSPEGTRMVPLALRYAWPAEMDLMARLAGLDLAERWGGWHREPFTAQSALHVSLWRKPG